MRAEACGLMDCSWGQDGGGDGGVGGGGGTPSAQGVQNQGRHVGHQFFHSIQSKFEQMFGGQC